MTYTRLVPHFFRRRLLSSKLIVLVSLMSAVVLCALCAYDYVQTRSALQDELKAFAAFLPAKMVLSLEPALAGGQFAQAEKILHANLQDTRIRCMVLHSSGKDDKTFGLLKDGESLSPVTSCPAPEGTFSQTTPLDGKGQSAGWLTVVYSKAPIEEALQDIVTRGLLRLLLLLAVLCPVLYVLLQRLVFAPLNTLSEPGEQIGSRQYADIVPATLRQDELSELSQRFNRMIEALADRDNRLHAQGRLLQKEITVRSSELAEKNAALEAANRHLVELDQLKSGFLSTVSHDLRTPLTSILGFSKLINQDFCKLFLPFAGNDKKLLKRGERIKHNLLIIQHEGERLTRLINDFLDLSRIESGRMQWRDTNISLRHLTKKAVEAVQGQLSLKPALEMRLEVGENLPMLHVDEDRIMQVLVNLLNNAIKFTPSGHIVLRAALHQDKLRIEVQDTGPGIPQDQLVKIFDKFHKVEEGEHQREKKPAGTGLGLAICRETVQHYNGRIWVESEPGRGSTFIIELPGFQPLQPSACIMETRAPQSNTRIMVVDDNAFIREYFNQLLSDAAYEVIQAKSGEEALEKARENVPDLIVMDLLMPGMGGEMAIRHFRSDPKLSCVPILIISISQDSLDYTGDARLEKPVDPEHFLEVVNSLLRQRRTQTPVLVVDHPDCLPADLISVPDDVEHIAADTVNQRIRDGFRGTFVLSRNTLNELSLDLQDQPAGINFLVVGCT